MTVRALGDGNALRTLRFGAATKRNRDPRRQAEDLNGNLTVDLSPASHAGHRRGGTHHRPTATVTVPLTVIDGCGDWPTFFGGGASAF